ncbi:MAG: VOC family protein [Candidatus Dojkabacteria bacterium]
MQKIVPSLWFDKNCEEAINYYISVFNDAPNKTAESKILNMQRYEKGMEAPGTEEMLGKVITAIFELNGQRFMALDGGPIFKFNESISFYVECADQAEVDHFWGKLSAVKESEQCGWLKDKFGLSWQIVPKQLGELMGNSNPEASMRVMNAMLQMKKLVVADLEKAAKGE